MRGARGVGTVVLLTLALAGCAGKRQSTQPGPRATPSVTQPAPGTTEPPSPVQETGQSKTVQMHALNESQQTGTATLTAVGGSQTSIRLELANSPAGPQPVHIHSGTCSNLGGIKYTLTPVANGKSETIVDVPLTDLLAGRFAINVHMSAMHAGTYVSCGEISA